MLTTPRRQETGGRRQEKPEYFASFLLPDPVAHETADLYTRPGCHLCDDLKETLLRVRRRQAFDLTEIDISRDQALEQRYGHDIPVLLIDGVKTARHRINDTALVRRLAAVGGEDPVSHRNR